MTFSRIKEAEMESSVMPPTAERMQHDPVIVSAKQISDHDGNIGSPFRVISVIPMLFERKAINADQARAAIEYMDDFDTGHLHPIQAAQYEQRGKGREELSNNVMRARNRIWKARESLGMGSPVERSAWAILGMRFSFKEWVDREGGIFSEQTAKRLLIAALHGLVDHYGYQLKKAS